MTFRDFLKNLEGQTLGHLAAPNGSHVLVDADSIMGTKCTLQSVEDDFIVLEFVKTSIFNASKTIYVPINMVYCDFSGDKK